MRVWHAAADRPVVLTARVPKATSVARIERSKIRDGL